MDKPGGAPIRAAARAAHLEYLTANKHKLLAAGALIDDDGTGGNGGILIVDTEEIVLKPNASSRKILHQGRVV